MTDTTTDKPSCCPKAEARAPLPQVSAITWDGVTRVAQDAVLIPGGKAIVGTRRAEIPDDGEDPLRSARVKPFRIGATAVTNTQFKAFVEATGYVTEAERFGWSFVFWLQVPEHIGATQGVPEVQWWRKVDGADWREVNGPGTHATAWHADHPVVHVSWQDAQEYAKWAGGRLPTEAEWDDFQPCNNWQGRFTDVNTAKDGYAATAPALSYEPNGYGLYNMCGNTWEWTADAFRIKSLKKQVKQRLDGMKGYKLSKGGSFLCHRSYCYRYRIAARSGNSPDSATTHQGFRVIWPAG